MRKRTSLDTSEANFIYAKVLLAFNKNEKLKDLPIPVKNKLIDEACENIINKANDNTDDIEALLFEIKSYRLSDEEKEKAYSNDVYEKLEKPKGFNELLKQKYSGFIEREIERMIEKLG